MAVGPAFANDCDAVASASLKQTGVPYRSEMTITTPGQPPQKAQAVYMVTRLYTQMDGKWNAVPVSAQEMSQQIETSIKNGGVSCRKIGPDQVGGEAATIYATHGVQQGNTVDTKTWISNSRNLPLRSVANIVNGPNSQTIDMTISYDHVSAPAGVK